MTESICEECEKIDSCNPEEDDCEKIMLDPSNLFESIRVKGVCPDCSGTDFIHYPKSEEGGFDNRIQCSNCKSIFEMWGRWNYTRYGEQFYRYYSFRF